LTSPNTLTHSNQQLLPLKSNTQVVLLKTLLSAGFFLTKNSHSAILVKYYIQSKKEPDMNKITVTIEFSGLEKELQAVFENLPGVEIVDACKMQKIMHR
jgi:hypothetical protein